MMRERNVEVNHSNIYRWVRKFTPKLEAESMQNRGRLSYLFEFFILHRPKARMPFPKRWFQFTVKYLYSHL
jgi:hypothetical protein